MWNLTIEDPSGETRNLPLDSKHTKCSRLLLGRSSQSDIFLPDGSLPSHAFYLDFPTDEKPYFRVQISESIQDAYIEDIRIREAHLQENQTLVIGETRIRITKDSSPLLTPPKLPTQAPPWLTQSALGTQTLWSTKKSAQTKLSLYIEGETGTGKEVLAKLSHQWSQRARGPFVPINCGALPVSLAESELFGHEKGAFTGALRSRAGAVLQAHGGTLFLDEIGDLPLDIQVKLLRFLEDGEIRPVGSDRPYHADVRFICATHRPLPKLVEEGRFRQDLYYRIASCTVKIPPLRERPEDIVLLANKFCRDFNKSLSYQASLRLQAYPWPGNVRELRHMIEKAASFGSVFSKTITEDDIKGILTTDLNYTQAGSPPTNPILTLREMEKVMVMKALKITQGNRAKAAKLLGIARSTLFEMLRRHRIRHPKCAPPLYPSSLVA